MDYQYLLWIILGTVLLNTWKDIVFFYWRHCTYIGSSNKEIKKKKEIN